MKTEGVVKFFDGKKGFGFIKRDGQGDVFIGSRALAASGVGAVETGDKLSFDLVEQNGRPPRAENIIKIIDSGAPQAQ